MSNYLENFLLKVENSKVKRLIPYGVCPFLFYNLTPYIITLTKGGWFDWVKRSDTRKKIDGNDFKKKEVNRLYPGEVLVRCPNPLCNIVAGLSIDSGKRLILRILASEQNCSQKHYAGEERILDKSDIFDIALLFSSSFTQILCASLTEQKVPFILDRCQAVKNINVETKKIIFPCRYHRKIKKFSSGILPEGFCIYVFHAVYPYVLALMYNAMAENILKIKCPKGSCGITIKLSKRYIGINKLIKPLFDSLRGFSAAVRHPIDLIDYRINIEVLKIEDISAQCLLKAGVEYPVNLNSEDFICPAAFHTLYPYLIAGEYGLVIQWGRDAQTDNIVACPDCVGAVYSIRKEEKCKL